MYRSENTKNEIENNKDISEGSFRMRTLKIVAYDANGSIVSKKYCHTDEAAFNTFNNTSLSNKVTKVDLIWISSESGENILDSKTK